MATLLGRGCRRLDPLIRPQALPPKVSIDKRGFIQGKNENSLKSLQGHTRSHRPLGTSGLTGKKAFIKYTREKSNHKRYLI